MLRSGRERVLQTLSFEAGGLVLSVPAVAWASGEGAGASALLLSAMSLVVMLWSPLHNHLFDLAELRLARRVASARPHRWRAVHAASHEVTAIAATLPLTLTVTDWGLGGALTLNAGLTAFYASYAYVFHLAFDRLRPVRPAGAAVTPASEVRALGRRGGAVGGQVHDEAGGAVGGLEQVDAVHAELDLLGAQAPEAAHRDHDRFGPALRVDHHPGDGTEVVEPQLLGADGVAPAGDRVLGGPERGADHPRARAGHAVELGDRGGAGGRHQNRDERQGRRREDGKVHGNCTPA